MIGSKSLKVSFLIVISFAFSIAQGQVSKIEMQSVLQETLMKYRNAVSNVTNSWRYDNTNDDYFVRDTITLSSARSYTKNYCKEIRWNFYENEKLVLENTPECTEPPTMLAPKKEDYLDLLFTEKNGALYLMLKNSEGIRDTFKVLKLQKNKPVLVEESMFDYTLYLAREN